METSELTTAVGDVKTPLREKILNRVLRCSHRNQGRPITLKGETFAICIDCGQHVAYNIRGLIPPKSIDGKPQPTHPPTKGFRGLLGPCLGLLAIGLGGGIYYSANRRVNLEKPASSHLVLPAPLPQSEPSSADSTANPPAMWTVIVPPQLEAAKAAPPDTRAREARRSVANPRLAGDRQFVLLTRKESAAVELSRHDVRMGQLIRSGSLFSVPRGTAIHVLQRKQRVAHIVIMEGSLAGKEGWVPASQLKQ